MKKFLLLSFLLVTLFSCSSDNQDIVQKNSGIIATTYSAQKSASATLTTVNCFKFEARLTVDSSNGLNNPIINFISVPPAGVSTVNGYKVRVEVQALSDCEDLTSGTGAITAYTNGTVYYSINQFAPTISVSPTGFPPCYRWRMVFEGASGKAAGCVSNSAWYDCPVI